MTADAFWAALTRAADALAPDLNRRFLRALQQLQREMQATLVVELVEHGRVVEAADLVLKDTTWAKAIVPFRDTLRASFLRGARVTVRTAPATLTPTREVVKVQYDVLHPATLTALRNYELTTLTGIREELRAGVLDRIKAGVAAGKGPRAIAEDIRESVGLTARMEQHVQHFEAELRAGDRSALRRALRDRRYDQTLDRILGSDAALTEAQIQAYVAAYRRRYVAFHAETIARTVSLDSAKAAQMSVWEQAIANGQIDRGDLQKTWIATMKGPAAERTRPGHRAMHRITIGFDEHWDVPIDGLVLKPGDGTHNCRCAMWIRPKFGVVLRPARPQLAA